MMLRKLLLFALGMAVGAIAGAVISSLLAPASGEEMRSGVRKRVREIVEESARAVEERRVQLEAELAELTRFQPNGKKTEASTE